jgi:O-antigen/teichoic acid export membrane protein
MESSETKALPSLGAAPDISAAWRNSLRLGTSLLATWSVALFVRFFLPRYLGPEHFGLYSFADSFAATYFVLLNLGIDTYIQKEVSVRPAHASDFFGGILLVRAALSAVLLAALALTLVWAGRSTEAQRLVFLFGLAQNVVSLNASLAALLQSNSEVRGLSVINVVGKLLWGAGIGVGLALGVPLEALAAVFLASEVVKCAALFRIARQQLSLVLRVDWAAAKRVIITSLPFNLNAVAVTLCAKLDVTMLAFLSNDDTQVGWYSASSNLASLSMLLSPLVGWVLMPLLSRAHHRSAEEFWAILRRCIEGIQTIALPVTLMMALGADVWIGAVFGPAFAPAAMSLRVLAPMFVFTYLAILLSMSLVVLNRPWTLTLISLTGMLINPLLNLAFIPLGARLLGEGGGGVGAAAGVVGMEMTVTTILFFTIGRAAFDRRSVTVIGRSLLVCAGVIALHLLLAPLGPWRLVADASAYVVLALAGGAVHLHDVKAVVGHLRERRR